MLSWRERQAMRLMAEEKLPRKVIGTILGIHEQTFYLYMRKALPPATAEDKARRISWTEHRFILNARDLNYEVGQIAKWLGTSDSTVTMFAETPLPPQPTATP